MDEPLAQRIISVPVMKYRDLRDPVKRLALVLMVNQLTWSAFAALDDETKALVLCECELSQAPDFHDAIEQFTELMRGKQAFALARSKGAGDAGKH